MAAIGFMAAPSITGAAYEGRNRTVVLLGVAYQGLGLVLMGAILGAWR